MRMTKATDEELKLANGIYGHDTIYILGELQTPETFEYVKNLLCAKYPELSALTPTRADAWLKQAAELLDIDYTVFVQELEKQVLRSYFIDQAHKELCKLLVDEKIPLYKKELEVGKVLRLRIYARQAKLWACAWHEAFKATRWVLWRGLLLGALPSLLFPGLTGLIMAGSLCMTTSYFLFKYHDDAINRIHNSYLSD